MAWSWRQDSSTPRARAPTPQTCVDVAWRLTIRLSDAGLRRRQTKLIYPNHRLPPWLNGDATRRSLEPIVRRLRDGVLRHHYSVTCRHNTLSSETTSPKAQTPANQAPANMSGANAMAQTRPPMAFTHTMYLATRDARADARTERSPASSAKTTAPMSSMTGNGLVVAAR